MDFLTHLWLPILASAFAVWLASALGWMLVGHHQEDSKSLPDEDAGMSTIRTLGLKPGVYMFPRCTGKQARSKEFIEKWEKGPAGILRVFAPANMGLCMAQSFAVNLTVSTLIAILGWSVLPHTVSAGADFKHVFHALAIAGVLGYVFGGIPGDIWYQESRRAMLMKCIDGVIYGLITGAIFAVLWPK